MNRLIQILSWVLLLATPLAAQESQTDTPDGQSAQEAKRIIPNVNEPLSVQLSRNGTYSLEAEPALRPMRLNQMHYWTLRLTDENKEPVTGATIAIDGGMPGHGHGLPTSPRVSPGDEPGEYILKGLRFNMGGEWLLQFKIEDGERSDQLQFMFLVEDATGR